MMSVVPSGYDDRDVCPAPVAIKFQAENATMFAGRNDVIKHATCALQPVKEQPAEERMVFSVYTKQKLVDLYKKVGIVPGHPFFEGPDDQDWTKPPKGWHSTPTPQSGPTIDTARNQDKPDFVVGASATCKDGNSSGVVKVLEFYPNGLELDSEPGPKYKVEWMAQKWKGQVSVVPAGDLSGKARWGGVET